MADTVSAILNAFLLPGEATLSLIGKISPQTEAIMRIDHGELIYPLIFSIVAWFIVLVIGLVVSKIVRNAFRQVGALIRTVIHLIKSQLGNLKTRLIWKYRKFFPHTSSDSTSVSQDQFDDLDIAVLASASRREDGVATSAKELAKKYKLQPAQVQERLDRLAHNHMLRKVSGSMLSRTGKYQLTDAGLAMVAMCERRASERLSLASASGSG
jgi:galactitol-specific phosphotransferase system IIC component